MTTAVVQDRTRWGVVALGFLAGVVGMAQTAKMSVALPFVQEAVGLDLVAASLSLTAVGLCGALFGVQAGRLCEAFGVVRTLVFALAVSGAAALATALVSDPAAFLAARLAEGFGYLLVCAAAPAMMAAFARDADRGLALAIWGAFVPVAVAIVSLVGPLVIVGFGWRALFLASAAAALAVAGWVALAVPEPKRLPRTDAGRFGPALLEVAWSAPRDFAVLYASLPSMGLAMAFMCFAGMQVGLIAIEPTFLIEARGLALPTVGLVLSATTPFAIAGTVLAGLLIRLGAPDRLVGPLGFAGMAASAAAVIWLPADPLSLILSGAVFFTAGGVVGSMLFASLPRRASAVVTVPLLSGLLVQFGNVGTLTGAPILASVAEAFGWEAMAIALVAMAALGAVAIIASRVD